MQATMPYIHTPFDKIHISIVYTTTNPRLLSKMNYQVNHHHKKCRWKLLLKLA